MDTVKTITAICIMMIAVPLCLFMLYRAVFCDSEKGWFALPAMICALLVSLSVMPAKPFENIREPEPVEKKIESVAGIMEVSDRETVYITPAGEKYHKPDCYTIRNEKIPIFTDEAEAEGIGACKICYK